jgi:hypothetical protein
MTGHLPFPTSCCATPAGGVAWEVAAAGRAAAGAGPGRGPRPAAWRGAAVLRRPPSLGWLELVRGVGACRTVCGGLRAVCFGCFLLRSTGQAPYGTKPACAKWATCPPLSSSPNAHSFVIGPAVIKHTHLPGPPPRRPPPRIPCRPGGLPIRAQQSQDPHIHSSQRWCLC